jgi:Xaa-Pro aminopeptidase
MNEQALDRAQTFLLDNDIDAWMVHDFRGNNPVLSALLGQRPHTTRRTAIIVPAKGAPTLLAHAIESGRFAAGSLPVRDYRTQDEWVSVLGGSLDGCRRVALEYSPGGQLPAVSWVDAGTLELVRDLGVEPVSSADLLQSALAVWAPEAVAGHRAAAEAVATAKDDAFAAIGEALRRGQSITEFDVQQRIGDALTNGGFETDHPAIVGVNEHSSDPHYAPTAAAASEIVAGDWILIDLWARRPGDDHVFADITWVARAAAAVTPRQQQVFDTVKQARDLIVDRLLADWERGERVEGWQLDQLARDLITDAGYGDRLLHRTGHSLSPGPAVHGLGANLDCVESHDSRALLPGTGFTIEPGVYLDDFGVRLEVDVYVDPDRGPLVTTPLQDDIILL